MSTMQQLRKYLFPVEVFFFLYMYTTIFQMFFYQQYYFQAIAQKKLLSLSNYTAPKQHICLAQDYIVNWTGNASFVAIQKEVNHLNMYSDVISIASSFFASMILGSLSDRLGRKPIVAVAIIGMVVSVSLQTLLVYFKWSSYFFLVSLAIHGFTGGFPLVTGICFAVVTDTTPKKWLGVRMSVLEAGISMGKVVAYLSTSNWIHNNGCSFFYPSLLNLGISILSLVYLLPMMESSPVATNRFANYEDEKEPKTKSSDSKIAQLFTGMKLFFNPKYLGFSKWWRIWFVTVVICLGTCSSMGYAEISNFFLHNKPLQWNYDKIGYFGAISGTFMTFILIFFLPLLVFLRISYQFISILGAICGVVCNVITALVKTSLQMYIAAIFRSTLQIMYPAMRILLGSHVSPTEKGAIFTMSAAFQMLASVIASIVFNEIYRPQAEVNGHLITASTAFWMMAGIWGACIPLALCLQFIKINEKHSAEVIIVDEKKPLLQDSISSLEEHGTIQ